MPHTHLDDNGVGEVANPEGGHAVHIRGWPSECHPGCTCFFWKNDFSLERLQHTYDLDVLLLMKLSWPISCELRLTLEVKGDQRGRVKQSMTLKTIISEKMRHNALSAIAAATRCGGSGVSCRLQPGRAVAVDSCSLQLGTENKNSTYYSFRDQWQWYILCQNISDTVWSRLIRNDTLRRIL